ncbi:GTP cyclohydrolase FolE2 [Halomonas sp. HNIBRBA4712]|uniref:GTP cyclohydrolase FolE2 n=1 Tax=Halomonas sp. HNIBRBA4712 TaxID=3373087 RepID=UPI003744FE82
MTAAVLPDISTSEAAPGLSPLEWVGMQNIAMPIVLEEPGYRRTLAAKVNAQVNLPALHIKGIHMSRLYCLLDEMSDEVALSPALLRSTMADMVATHRDCASDSARLRFCFDLMLRRPALLSEGLAGWKTYPVQLDAHLQGDVLTLRARVAVTYSSTCPCSAALSRQLVERAFREAFAETPAPDIETVAEWLRDHATLATPHSQRSHAYIEVSLPEKAEDLGLIALVDRIEATLKTPVQTAVKRADEQAFAALNGSNLMFVEDAARRLQQALSPLYAGLEVNVEHLESLHAHDAVAWAKGLSQVPGGRASV